MSAYVTVSQHVSSLSPDPSVRNAPPSTTQHGVVQIRTDLDIVVARYIARDVARGVGFHPVEQARIATAVSELVHTVVLYAHTGKLEIHALTEGQTSGIEIIIEDQSVGASRLARAVQEDQSATQPLFGLSGMTRARQLMDSFEVQTQVGAGVRIVCRKLRHESE